MTAYALAAGHLKLKRMCEPAALHGGHVHSGAKVAVKLLFGPRDDKNKGRSYAAGCSVSGAILA
jgi:hypothetical protein